MESIMDDQMFQEVLNAIRRHGSDNAEIEIERAQKGLPQDLWETLSAFGNSTGGLLILGVDEKSGFTVTGVDDAAAAEHQLAILCGEMEPPIRSEEHTSGPPS